MLKICLSGTRCMYSNIFITLHYNKKREQRMYTRTCKTSCIQNLTNLICRRSRRLNVLLVVGLIRRSLLVTAEPIWRDTPATDIPLSV